MVENDRKVSDSLCITAVSMWVSVLDQGANRGHMKRPWQYSAGKPWGLAFMRAHFGLPNRWPTWTLLQTIKNSLMAVATFKSITCHMSRNVMTNMTKKIKVCLQITQMSNQSLRCAHWTSFILRSLVSELPELKVSAANVPDTTAILQRSYWSTCFDGSNCFDSMRETYRKFDMWF